MLDIILLEVKIFIYSLLLVCYACFAYMQLDERWINQVGRCRAVDWVGGQFVCDYRCLGGMQSFWPLKLWWSIVPDSNV